MANSFNQQSIIETHCLVNENLCVDLEWIIAVAAELWGLQWAIPSRLADWLPLMDMSAWYRAFAV